MEGAIVFIVVLALLLYPAWRIFGKAGFTPWLALLLLIPGLGGLICIVILAFARWPALSTTK